MNGQFLKKLNDAARSREELRRDEALGPFLTGCCWDEGRQVNPWSVIDAVELRYLRPVPGTAGDARSWEQFKSDVYRAFDEAINRGVENSAAETIVLSFGRQTLEWMREYNREKAHQYRRPNPW